MPRNADETAFTTLKRLHELVRFLLNIGPAGATFDRIAENIYDFDPRNDNRDSVRRKFNRDRKLLMNLYDDESDRVDTKDFEVDEQSAVILQKRSKNETVYYLNSGFHFMMPMKLSQVQAAAMAFSLRITEGLVSPFSISSGELWEKLKRQFSDDFVKKSDRLMDSIESAIPVSKPEEQHVRDDAMRKVADAIQRVKVLKFSYADRDGEISSCILSPYVIFLRYHSWYVMGDSPNKRDKDQPAFRLDRMKKVEVLDADQPHPFDEEKLEWLKRNILLDFNPSRPNDEYRVKLRITGSFVKPCMETEWFPGEKKTQQKDSSLLYEVRLKGLEWITLWIMRALDCMEVLEPKELRDRIDDRVKAYCDRMSERNSQTPEKIS